MLFKKYLLNVYYVQGTERDANILLGSGSELLALTFGNHYRQRVLDEISQSVFLEIFVEYAYISDTVLGSENAE